LHRKNNTIYVNGLFRHGFLLGPAMAVKVAQALSSEQSFESLPLCA
jgi:glycine/D-amino acid oxidase-like deaminating enzyme